MAHEAYYRALKADDEFQQELTRVYGKRAGDMRYRPDLWKDSRIKAAAKKKHEADAALHREWEKRRESNPGPRRHSAKWDRCVKDVKRKGSAVSPYAVCTSRVGNPSPRRGPWPRGKVPPHLRKFLFK